MGRLSLTDLKCFTRIGKVFCVLTVYFDESYNERTMCIGGWLGKDTLWKTIESKWDQRIKFESAASVRKGLKPLSRYHATDCASRVREFEGWDVPRQIQLTKRLLEIIGTGNHRIAGGQLIGVACGVSFKELQNAYPQFTNDLKKTKWECYRMCMGKCLQLIGDVMQDHFPHDKVTVIHDRSKEFSGAAQSVYDIMLPPENPMKRYFISIAPGDWQDFTALQPADFIAFEGFRLTDRCKRGQEEFQRSMQALVGKHNPLAVGYFTPESFGDFRRMGVTV